MTDYDVQMNHLSKELGDIGKEYSEWETATRPVSNNMGL